MWPDAYYMSMNVFNSAGTAFLGPQPFAFDRAKMLAGLPATFVSTGITGGPGEDAYLPTDLDGSTLPPAGAPATFVEFPATGVYKVFHMHADFAVPANTTFTLFASPPAAGFTLLCPFTRSCVPQLGSADGLDAIADRLMHRLAYRNFGAFESVVGNYTVSSGGVAGIRWFELRNVTAGPVTVFQESTYQPDTTWRWMGSAAQDKLGNLALGFSASSAAHLPADPLRRAVIERSDQHAGAGGSPFVRRHRQSIGHRQPLGRLQRHDCRSGGRLHLLVYPGVLRHDASFNWRTRIGNFKFANCTATPTPVIVANGSSITAEGCAPPNNVIDPNETVTVSFCLGNIGSGSTTNLVGTLQNTGGVTGASGPQTYGAIAPGATVCKPFTFTATGTCGGTLTATIHLQDGANDLGNAVFNFTLGSLVTTTAFSQNFDGVVAPALPAGWTTTASGAESPWVTSATTPFSAPNDAFAPEPDTPGLAELTSPTIAVPAGAWQVNFKNNYNTESTFDGMVLEISIDGGAFQDILAAGGSFTAGGYNSTISTALPESARRTCRLDRQLRRLYHHDGEPAGRGQRAEHPVEVAHGERHRRLRGGRAGRRRLDRQLLLRLLRERRDADTDSDSDQYADEHADQHACSADQYSDCHADEDPDQHADRHADEDADQHACSADQYSDEYSDEHADRRADEYPNPDADEDAEENADQYADDYSDPDSVCRHGHGAGRWRDGSAPPTPRSA